MARKKKPATRKKRKAPKRFRFQLSLVGVAGIAVVAFCQEQSNPQDGVR